MAVSSLSLQLLERLGDRQLSARETIEGRGGARRRRLGIGALFDLHKRQLTADLVQPVFDSGIADAEVLLHLLDRSVAPDESCHEYLILGRQLRQRREVEATVDGHALLREPDALDFEAGATSEFRQRLPVERHNQYLYSILLSFSRYNLIISTSGQPMA